MMRGTARHTEHDATKNVGVEGLLSLPFLRGLAPLTRPSQARTARPLSSAFRWPAQGTSTATVGATPAGPFDRRRSDFHFGTQFPDAQFRRAVRSPGPLVAAKATWLPMRRTPRTASSTSRAPASL